MKLFHRTNDWRIAAGSWTSDSRSRVILNGDEAGEQGESMAFIGRRDWRRIELQLSFQFLTNTISPPDGGAILFFLAENAKNHLAFHFCIAKNSIQLFKRVRGMWNMLDEMRFRFRLNQTFRVEVRSRSGIHQCLMEDGTLLKVEDREISRGCVGIGGKFCTVEFHNLSLSAA